MSGSNATLGGGATVLPPRGFVATEMRQGQYLRVTDLEGGQVGDLVAFAGQTLAEKFWISNTIRLNGTIYLGTGHVLYSELSRPLLTIVDTNCARHTLLAGSCNAEIDKVRYDADNHRGCVENFVEALRPWGARREDIPMSFNLFMNSPVQPDGSFSIERPVSKAGDFIELRAEMDLIVAMSNCPQDLNPVNAGIPKTLGWQVSDAPG